MDNNVTLQITRTGTRNLGRCYNATTWRIESRKPMSWDNIKALRAGGILGYGQEFYGKALREDGTHDIAWAAKYETNRQVYTYEVEDRVDSSD